MHIYLKKIFQIIEVKNKICRKEKNFPFDRLLKNNYSVFVIMLLETVVFSVVIPRTIFIFDNFILSIVLQQKHF